MRYQIDACSSLALPFVYLTEQGNPIADDYLSDTVFLAVVSSSGQCETCSLGHPACVLSWESQQHCYASGVYSHADNYIPWFSEIFRHLAEHISHFLRYVVFFLSQTKLQRL